MCITPIRTLEELRTEFISDIERRIKNLALQERFFAHKPTEKAKIARVKIELANMMAFWREIQFAHGKKPKAD